MSFWPQAFWQPTFWPQAFWPTAAAPIVPFPVDLVGFLGRNLPDLVAYPCRLPEKGVGFPSLTFNLIASSRPPRLAGSSGLAIDRYQFDIWGDDLLAATIAAERLRVLLQNYRGPMGYSAVLAINLKQTMTGYEPPIDKTDVGRFRVMFEFSITRAESIPGLR